MTSDNYLRNLRIIQRWEDNLTTPPEDMYYESCVCCSEPIVDKLYLIDGKKYCKDCALDLHRVYVIDEEIECCSCGEPIDPDDCYYDVNGDAYCERCFIKNFED